MGTRRRESPKVAPEWQAEPEVGQGEKQRTRADQADGTVLRLSAVELTRLAPRLQAYLKIPAPGLAGDHQCRRLVARRIGYLESGRSFPSDGPRTGCNRNRNRLSQIGGTFPVNPGRVFPWHGAEGEDREPKSRTDYVGYAKPHRQNTTTAHPGRTRRDPFRTRTRSSSDSAGRTAVMLLRSVGLIWRM